ncbi:unnamed protein product [Eruca vesicaria subsp. sativa]|uniref:Uncharacterized protein n=1 Tax=Eruca vesicaria subsp. sativa TaxID=29727 RepID=A0ABC8KEP5_ERUVS|nr:unnamed protein product [Eruca vesicaria subsp. sativa]
MGELHKYTFLETAAPRRALGVDGEFDGNATFAGGSFMPSQSTTQAHESSSAFKASYL